MTTDSDTVATQDAATRTPARPWSPRTDRAARWVGWHLGELTLTAVPAVMSVAVHPLWLLPTGLVIVAWVANERRLARKAAGVRHGVLTTDGGAGTDTASPTPGVVGGGDVPGDVEGTREPA